MLTGLLLAAFFVSSAPDIAPGDQRVAYEVMLDNQAEEAAAQFGGGTCTIATAQRISATPIQVPGQPDIPALHEKLRVSGCGASAVENIDVARFGGTPPWRMVVGLPGDSLALVSLQQAAWPAALQQAKADLPQTCGEHRLKDIYIAARPGGVQFLDAGAKPVKSTPGHLAMSLPADMAAQRARFDLTQAWAEIWPIEMCGQDRTTGVVFIPLADHSADAYLFLPLWREIAAHGAAAAPPPAP